MAQLDTSEHNTEIDKINEREERLYTIALEGYYKKPELVRFLLIENLAIKSLLAEKGMLDLDEYQDHVKQATAILEAEVRRQLDEWKQNNPQEAVLFDILADLGVEVDGS